MKIGFYLLGKKGYFVLDAYKNKFGLDTIAFVMGARDSGIENDWYSDIAEWCTNNKIVFHTRGEINNEVLPNADFKFAIGWRWMINDASNLIVFHDSLLPKYRGFSPLVNMLIDGVDEIGVTALLASDEYDKGAILYQEKNSVSYPIKISDGIDKIVPLYEKLVINTASDILSSDQLNYFQQDESLASYSLWRDEKDYLIDWNSTADKIKRFVDAVGAPYKGATTYLNGEIVRILDGESIQDVRVENRTTCIGKVIFIQNLFPVVVCGSGLFKISDLRSTDANSLIGKIKFRSRFGKHEL